MRKQQGLTLVGMLLTVLAVFFAAVIVMKIVPVVIQHYTILSAVKALNDVPAASLSGDPEADVAFLKDSLAKRFDLNGIDDLKPDELVINEEGTNKFKVHVKYQAVRSLVYNVSLLFSFDDTLEVSIGGQS